MNKQYMEIKQEQPQYDHRIESSKLSTDREPGIINDYNVLKEIEEQEKSIRSKILNQQCRKRSTKSAEPAEIMKTTPEKSIEKIQLKSDLTDTEEKISNILRNHSTKFPIYLYFQPVIETAPLSIGSITEENLEDCENPEDIIHTTDQTKIIETKYKYLEHLTLRNYLNKLKREPKYKNRYLQILVTIHLQLLESIEFLQSIDTPIIHFNITPDTILYDKINATPVITDFRIAFTKETLDDPEKSQELFPVFNNSYWAPEINAIAHLIETNGEIVTESNDPNINTILQPYMNQSVKEVIQELKTTYESWDIYAVNQIILEQIQPINNAPFRTTMTTPFIERYIEICKQHPQPKYPQDPPQEPTQDPPQDPPRDPPQDPTQDPLQDPPQDPLQDTQQEPTKEPPQKNNENIQRIKKSIENLFQSIPKIEYEQFLQNYISM